MLVQGYNPEVFEENRKLLKLRSSIQNYASSSQQLDTCLAALKEADTALLGLAQVWTKEIRSEEMQNRVENFSKQKLIAAKTQLYSEARDNRELSSEHKQLLGDAAESITAVQLGLEASGSSYEKIQIQLESNLHNLLIKARAKIERVANNIGSIPAP